MTELLLYWVLLALVMFLAGYRVGRGRIRYVDPAQVLVDHRKDPISLIPATDGHTHVVRELSGERRSWAEQGGGQSRRLVDMLEAYGADWEYVYDGVVRDSSARRGQG